MQENILFDADQMVESGVGIIAPTGLNTSHDVFAFYSRALAFPDYFGWNWNAFDECIHDLSWLGAETTHIAHKDIPLHHDILECTYFLSALNEIKLYSRTEGKIMIHFMASDRNKILDILFKHYRSQRYLRTNEYLECYRRKENWNVAADIAMCAINKGLATMYAEMGFLKGII